MKWLLHESGIDHITIAFTITLNHFVTPFSLICCVTDM